MLHLTRTADCLKRTSGKARPRLEELLLRAKIAEGFDSSFRTPTEAETVQQEHIVRTAYGRTRKTLSSPPDVKLPRSPRRGESSVRKYIGELEKRSRAGSSMAEDPREQ